MADLPRRITWAVRELDVREDDEILEVGCGDGHALTLIAARLRTGHVVGLDRSPLAIRSSRKRNAAALANGRLRLVESELADARIDGTFTKVFALNVNVFWHRPKRELAVIRDLLAPDGRLLLMFEPPSADQLGQISELCRRNLEANGFRVTDELRADLPATAVMRITAQAED